MMKKETLYRRLIELLDLIQIAVGVDDPNFSIIRKRILDIANDIMRLDDEQ